MLRAGRLASSSRQFIMSTHERTSRTLTTAADFVAAGLAAPEQADALARVTAKYSAAMTDQLVAQVDRVASLSPEAIRAFAQRHLDISQTVSRYEGVLTEACAPAPRRLQQRLTPVDLRAAERGEDRITTTGGAP